MAIAIDIETEALLTESNTLYDKEINNPNKIQSKRGRFDAIVDDEWVDDAE